MAKKNRDTLKKCFQKGRLPTEEMFGDLIDSMLNIIDEGFDKSPNEGLKIFPIGESEKYISFFEKVNIKSPVWSIGMDLKSGNLMISDRKDNPVVSLSDAGRVGVGKRDPDFELDVEGTVAARGRTGTFRQGAVPADGNWHVIAEDLEGCNALEVIAGAGKRYSGKYGLLHAHVLNTFNGSHRIKHSDAWYGSRCNRLKLRWQGTQESYCLEIKSRCHYGEAINIRYSITELWFDHFMTACEQVPQEGS